MRTSPPRTPAQELANNLKRVAGVAQSGDEARALKMLRSFGFVRLNERDNPKLHTQQGN